LIVAGIDEVGYGSWAGPVTVACVSIEGELYEVGPLEDVRDSKKLSKPKIKKLARVISAKADYLGLGWSFPNEINLIGLKAATIRAVNRAILNCNIPVDLAIMDGSYRKDWHLKAKEVEWVVKGDSKIFSIACASIVAKAERDLYMENLIHSEYPQYGFYNHVGYGTKRHQEALEDHGFIKGLHRVNNGTKKYV